MKIKILIITALVVALFSCSAFSEFIFSDLYNPLGKIVIGGYFALMAYQILTPYPIVIETNLNPFENVERFNYGLQFGPFIMIDYRIKNDFKEQVIAHELEHLYQEATINFVSAAVIRTVEYLRAGIEGHCYNDNMFEVLARRAQIKIINGKPVLYFSFKIEF